MMPSRYGQIAINNRRRGPPPPPREAYLPMLLERRLHLDNPRPIPIRPPPRPTRMIHPRPPPMAQIMTEPPPPRSLEEATNDLVKHIDANRDAISQAILSLREHDLRDLKIPLIVKHIFSIFDTAVFLDKLRGRVSFHGHGAQEARPVLGPNDSGKTIMGRQGGGQYADIVLNSAAFEDLLNTREGYVAQDLIIAAVLHQMIHAYFAVACGPQSDDKKACTLLSHSEHFGIVMYKIKQCSAGRSGPPLPLNFGNTIPERVEGRGRVWDPPSRSSAWMDERRTSTECARGVKVLTEDECEDWYRDKCLKTLDPNILVYSPISQGFEEKPVSKCGDKADWVELCYKKKSYKVPRKAFDMLPSFRRKFADSERKLDISADFRKETVEELVRFLLEELEEYALPDLRTCIELYKLGSSLKFEELKEVMIDAVYQEQIVHPSPQAILEVLRAVYGGPTQPDGALRDWAIDLVKALGATAIRTATKDPRLSRLRGSSSAFRNDIARAVHELGPAALAPANDIPHAAQAQQQVVPGPATLSSYTFTPAPVQVTTTAASLPGPSYTARPPYRLLPYSASVSPVQPTRWRAPLLELEDDGWGDAVPWAEPIAIPIRHTRFG